MKRFEVLKKETPILGKFFLEASAGTGKTFAIEHIVVRSLLESEEPLTIAQILVVTFTRAATRELKLRLRSNLAKTYTFLEKGEGGPEYLQRIYEQGDGAIFSAKRKIEEALCHFDEAPIFTLHGFCHKMLMDFSFQANIYLEMERKGSSHDCKKEELVKDVFRAGLYEEHFSPAQIELLLANHSHDVSKLIKRIIRWMDNSIEIEKYPTSEELRSLWIMQLKQFDIAVARKLLIEDIESILACYKKMKPYYIGQAHDLYQMILQQSIEKSQWDQLIRSKEFFLDFLKQENLKKGKDSHLFLDRLEKLRTAFLPIKIMAQDERVIFLRLLEYCQIKWKQSTAAFIHHSPDDLLVAFHQAIQQTDLRDQIAATFSIGIIDEFQDTDPVQWEIFTALFLQYENKTIYLVGDPKQSIYSFRKADVYTYLQAMKDVGETNRLYLDTNYRSSPELVCALNALFTKEIAKEWMQLPAQQGYLEIHPVEHGRKEGSNRLINGSSIEFFIAQGPKGKSKKWPSEGIEKEQIFPYIGLQIQELVQKEGFRYGQIAILVRDRYQSARLEQFLESIHIPCDVKKPLYLDQSAAYLSLYDVICAFLYPSDSSALKKVLLGPFISIPANQLLGGMDNPILQQARMYFEAENKRISTVGWMGIIQNFLQNKFTCKTVLQTLLAREDSSFYFEFRQILQILQEHCPDLFSVSTFVSFYESLALLEPEDEVLSVSKESEEDQVVIMTIHASKGLEFDVVFALGVVSRFGGKEDVLRIQTSEGERLEKKDLENPLCKRSLLENDAEKMRHLYVAFTRAKEKLYIPVAIDTDQKKVEEFESSSIDLLSAGFGIDSFEFSKIYDSLHLINLEDWIKHLSKLSSYAKIGYTILSQDFKIQPKKMIKDQEEEFSFPSFYNKQFPSQDLCSFSSLHNHVMDPLITIPKVDVNTLPAGSSTGNLLHRILEIIFKESLHHPYQKAKIQQMVEKHCQGHSLENWKEDVFKCIETILHTPFITDEEEFTLQQVPSESFFLENEFAFEIEGKVMKGFIDAVFMFRKKYYLLDWKSNFLGNSLEDYSKETIKQVMKQQQYDLQAAIYTEALRRYLQCVEKRSFKSCFGGAFYVFLRGPYIYHFMPKPWPIDC